MTTQCTVLLRRPAHTPRTIARMTARHGRPLRRAMTSAQAVSEAAPAATVSVFISTDNESPREIARFINGKEIEL